MVVSMNGYVCFYQSKRIEVYASSLYEAKQKAIAQFKPPKSKLGLVSVTLAELDAEPGKQGTQVTTFIDT